MLHVNGLYRPCLLSERILHYKITQRVQFSGAQTLGSHNYQSMYSNCCCYPTPDFVHGPQAVLEYFLCLSPEVGRYWGIPGGGSLCGWRALFGGWHWLWRGGMISHGSCDDARWQAVVSATKWSVNPTGGATHDCVTAILRTQLLLLLLLLFHHLCPSPHRR